VIQSLADRDARTAARAPVPGVVFVEGVKAK